MKFLVDNKRIFDSKCSKKEEKKIGGGERKSFNVRNKVVHSALRFLTSNWLLRAACGMGPTSGPLLYYPICSGVMEVCNQIAFLYITEGLSDFSC
jgi:hypothetical protein